MSPFGGRYPGEARRRAGRLAATLVVVALALVAPGCGRSGDGGGSEATIAFLRAVAGAPSTEPAFLAELAAAGYRAGDNLTVLAEDPALAYPDPDDAAAVVRSWRDEGVDLVVALSSSGAMVAAAEAPDVDVLFLSNDPVSSGLVGDREQPEGRSSGVTFQVPADRTLELAARALVGVSRFGLVYPPSDPAAIANREAMTSAAAARDVELHTAEFDDGDDLDEAVAAVVAAGAQALVVSTSPAATRLLTETEAAAAARGLPLVANTSLVASAVVSLYPDSDELGRQLGRQAARLLSGAAPGSVPVEDPRRFMVRINQRVAAGLGFAIPDAVLLEANDVVQ